MEGRLIWTIAQLTAVTTNIAMPQGHSPVSTTDFVPRWVGEEPPLSDEEEQAVMDAKFNAYNARVARQQGGERTWSL